mmetsp:Transcript_60899/g.163020  ORF Transcript_60899/g.163020 Transcript_60899/m.163020 type:complete len:2559 (+) Transcript_60899:1883-9559(+)
MVRCCFLSAFQVRSILDNPPEIPPVTYPLYTQVCSHSNPGTTQCSTGDTSTTTENTVYLNPGCLCLLIDSCATDGQLTFYLNRSKQILVNSYMDGVRKALLVLDRSCGGLPVGASPNNFSLGKVCNVDNDCSASSFPKCDPTKGSCFCCANINAQCSTDSDCQQYATNSYCGCVRDPSGQGICGPYFDAKTNAPVNYDPILASYPANIQRTGTSCSFAMPSSTSIPTDRCIAAAFARMGSAAEAVIRPLKNVGAGSSSIQIMGNLDDVNRGLGAISYKTNPYYNLLYRIPVSQRTSLYDVTVDSSDSLVVTANDLGNSGGSQRAQQSTVVTLPVVSSAVNNAPGFVQPIRVTAYEDNPLRVVLNTSVDGNYVVTSSMDGELRMYDGRDGSLVRTFDGHTDPVNGVVFSDDDSYIVSCSGKYDGSWQTKKTLNGDTTDNTIRLWDVPSGVQMMKLPLQGGTVCHYLGVSAIVLNEASTIIVSGGYDNAVCLWDFQTGKMLMKFGGLSQVTTSNGTVYVQSDSYHAGVITALGTFMLPSSDTDTILNYYAVSCSDDSSFRVWDIRVDSTTAFSEVACVGPSSARCRVPRADAHTQPVICMTIMNTPPAPQVLVTGSEDGNIKVWSLVDFSLLKTLRTIQNGQYLHLRHVLALASHPTMTFLGQNSIPVVVSVGGVRSPYDRSKYTQNPDPKMVIWNLNTGEAVSIISISVANPTLKPFTALKVTSDGNYIISSSEDLKTVMWDINTQAAVRQYPCACLCYSTKYPDPTARCKQLPCTSDCPASPTAWAPTLAVTSNFLSRNAVRITDPDSSDYGFDSRSFTMNLSCSHGLLHLNEYFLQSEKRCSNDNSLCRTVKDCITAGDDQAPQCKTLSRALTPLTSMVDTTLQTGILASAPRFGIGNEFIAISGTMSGLNKALTGLVYVGNKYFNTMLTGENIVGTVNDGGAIDSSNSQTPLSYSFSISTIVRGINNPVEIGQYINSNLLPINTTENQLCFSIPPSGSEYTTVCGPGLRHYIDIDEDTTFYLTPDILWINDVDSEDAVKIFKTSSLTYECSDTNSDSDCTCGQVCKCGSAICQCSAPAACDTSVLPPGKLLVQLSVSNGLLSLQAPPGRNSLPVTYFQNTTTTPIGTCLKGLGTIIYEKLAECFKACTDEIKCSVNTSVLLFSIELNDLQTALQQKYLTYRPNPNYYGTDNLVIWAIDQGYTDSLYSYTLSVTAASQQVIAIRVVAINDPPTVSYPNYVLRYQGNLPCYVDYMAYKTAVKCPTVEVNPKFYNYSSVPPLDGTQKSLAFAQPQIPYIQFADVDMDGTIYGNMSLLIQIGQEQTGYAGRFTISQIHMSVQNFQFFNSTQNRGLLYLDGRLENINTVMERLYFDPNPSFQGICSFYIRAFDNNNYGECDGDHKCGASQACDNGLDAQPHNPSTTGQGNAIIDVIAGGSSLCVASTCTACKNLPEGCGWCHGTCRGAGKCMIGKGSPRFESCETNSSFNLDYGVCDQTTTSLIGLAVAIGVVVLGLAVGFYYFRRFVLSRYGGFYVYFRKVTQDLSKVKDKLKLGDAGPSWQFKFALFAVVFPLLFILESLLSSTATADCNYNQEFFLDTSNFLVLDLDYCNVRFLKASNFPTPRDNQITALKVKFALTPDPNIILDAELCRSGGDAYISIQNSRPVATRYKGYFCNVVLLVPDKLVVPSVTIQDNHGFATSVRSGSMDADSPDFNLNFGPNTFSLYGQFMNVRLRGVNAKYFNFNVNEGTLFAEAITAIYGTFTASTADIMVTSSTQTSARVWQKSGNKVCLTAANNSLYVNDACNDKCEYFPTQTMNYTNVSVTYLTQANCTLDTVGGKWVTTRTPAVCQLQCPDLLRPLVPGCVDFTTCTALETAICLCKPTCDMVPASQLSYNGISGVAGTCNDAGQCCRTVCAGYSKADLFPDPNEPRNGFAAAGTAKPWTPNNLAQQWTFTSDAGVISFQVLTSEQNTPARHSWQGAAPVDEVDLTPDLGTDARDAMDKLFHPGGANEPKVEKFYFMLSGAGTPEPSQGHFEWVSDVRYLIIPHWLLRASTFGLLQPQQSSSTGRLSQAFCPNSVTNELIVHDRYVKLFSLIFNSLQYYPADQPSKPLPTGSMIVYRPLGDTPLIFQTDPTTGITFLSAFDVGGYLFIMFITIVGFVAPFAIALAVTFIAAWLWKKYVDGFREDVLKEQVLAVDGLVGNLELDSMKRDLINQRDSTRAELLDAESQGGSKNRELARRLRMKQTKILQELADLERRFVTPSATRAQKEQCISTTGFFNMYEELEGGDDRARDLFSEILLVAREVLVAFAPAGVPLYGASVLQTAYLDFSCEFAPDACACYAAPPPIYQPVRMISYIFWAVSGAELGFHLIAMGYTLPRRIVRHSFYPLYFALIGATVFVITVVACWICLGVLLFPLKVLPYACAMVGLGAVGLLVRARRMAFRERLERMLRARVDRSDLARRLARRVRPEMLNLVVKRRINQALASGGCSLPRVALAALSTCLGLGLVYGFLFIGFKAFSDPTDSTAGLLNATILTSLTLAVIQVTRPLPVGWPS